MGFTKCAALVVPDEVFHILQDESGRLVVIENVGDRKEEIALFHILEAVLAAEAVFLWDAGEVEVLAGKIAAKSLTANLRSSSQILRERCQRFSH